LAPVNLFRRALVEPMSFPVMMIHGMCCTGDVWQNFRSYFEARGNPVFTPTLRPDQRMRRGAPRSLGQVTLADYAEDLAAEVAEVRRVTGQRPALIGHSMGGLLTQLMAERDLISAAVLLSPTPPKDARGKRDHMLWGAIRLFGSVGLVPSIIRVPAPAANRRVLNVAEGEARQRANSTFVAESGRVFRDFATCSIDTELVQVPVLTVSARRDRLVPPRWTRMVGEKYAAVGGDFIEYDDHGHWIYDEPGWERPAEEIHEWLHRRAKAG